MIDNLRNVKHKLVVMSGKGGVGKSTVAANLAHALVNKGYKVGLLDADVHGPTLPKLFGVVGKRLKKGKEGIAPLSIEKGLEMVSVALLLDDAETPIIWRGPLKMGLIKQFLEEIEWGKLDYLIIDLPPGTGDEPLTIAQLLPEADGAIIVTTPQDVALHAVRRSIKFAEMVNLRVIGLIENMSGLVCPHCGEEIELFAKGGGAKTAKDMGIEYLGSVPIDPSVVASGESGTPFAGNGNIASVAFAKITDNILSSEKKYGKALAKRKKALNAKENEGKPAEGTSATCKDSKPGIAKKDGTIDKDTTIGDVLRAKPKAGEVLKRHGMHCIGCPSAAGETLAQAARVHKMDKRALDALIEEISKL